MKNLITFFASLTLSSLMIGTSLNPAFSQSVNNPGEVITKTITLKKEGREQQKLNVTGTSAQINDVIAIIAVLYDSNVEMANVELASQLILGGADPIETGNLMLALNGMAVPGQDVNLNRLNSAINAYNAIIDKADADTIASLQKTEAFMDIGELLRELRTQIG